MWAPAAVAGFGHGLGLAAMLGNDLGEGGAGLASLLLAVLGMDATHLVIGVALTVLLSTIAELPAPARLRRLMSYGVGAAGVAAALALAIQGGVVQTDATAALVMMPDGTAGGVPTGSQGSRRLAPSVPNAPIHSFLSVEPFEVRHEVMLRLGGLQDELDLDPDSTLGIGAQGAIAERLTQLVLGSTTLLIDGANPEAVIRRADFMTVDLTGALPRPNPVDEIVAEAVMGVIIAYPTSGMPRSVELEWRRFPTAMEAIPATVIDPESVTSETLSPDEPVLAWRYALAEDPVPTVEAVTVEPVELPIALAFAAVVRGFGVARVQRNPRRAKVGTHRRGSRRAGPRPGGRSIGRNLCRPSRLVRTHAIGETGAEDPRRSAAQYLSRIGVPQRGAHLRPARHQRHRRDPLRCLSRATPGPRDRRAWRGAGPGRGGGDPGGDGDRPAGPRFPSSGGVDGRRDGDPLRPPPLSAESIQRGAPNRTRWMARGRFDPSRFSTLRE